MSGRTRKRSPHNEGRKPLYKEHRANMVLEPAEVIIARGPRYWNGMWADKNLNWRDEDSAALFSLCGAGAELEACADVLARPPKTIAHRASDVGLKLPEAWWRPIISPAAWATRQRMNERRIERRENAASHAERIATSPRGRQNYPFVAAKRPEHVDLLAVNALVPKGIPEWIRADICQNIMLALLEGETTLEDLKANRASLNYFVRKFYREEVDRNLISFDHRDDDRAYDEIAAAVSRDEWDLAEVQDRRRAYDTLATFVRPEQVGEVYNAEIKRAQKAAHASGDYLSWEDIEDDVETGTRAVPDELHAIRRAGERYGLSLTRYDIRAMESAIRAGKSTFISNDADGERHLVEHAGKVLLVAWKPSARIIMTILPRDNAA